ncbi:hypothetical protein Lesp02_57040 [Lentzea sp. NBRC 105346]|uniref:hypothetical protein n=1 Tax=Lentzea sp. NBRC 105346 TaxID=3032205 RepID=UPI0024A46C58|nr:hypothetical protein [Lentzea sp. NBRC 105346]GLZ33516.1 hypothetical protein Lesp02_57040 [Lentzea sp. NBRC 105346]
MSRTGLFRAAALLAAGASPLLVGAASAAETPNLPAAPDAGTDKLIDTATGAANPLDATKAVQLPSVKAPGAPQVAPQVKTPAAGDVKAPAAERSLPVGSLPVGTLPTLPDAGTVPDAKVADLQVPAVSKLPGLEQVQGQLPALG